MARGRRIPEELEKLFKGIWAERIGEPRKVIIREFRSQKLPNNFDIDISDRKLHDFLKKFETEARDDPLHYEDPPYEWSNRWDETTPDDTALYFRLIRLCRLRDHPLPNQREVKWIKRLAGVFRGSADGDLHLMEWAINYARREKASQISEQPLNTADLDDCLAFRVWEDPTEYETAVKSGAVSAYREQPDLKSEMLLLFELWVLSHSHEDRITIDNIMRHHM